MTITIKAVYDGQVFRPIEPIPLQPNTPVQIVVAMEEEEPISFLDVARSLNLDGPPDWSVRLDEYLYGGETMNGE